MVMGEASLRISSWQYFNTTKKLSSTWKTRMVTASPPHDDDLDHLMDVSNVSTRVVEKGGR
jgi:hypothetical protein